MLLSRCQLPRAFFTRLGLEFWNARLKFSWETVMAALRKRIEMKLCAKRKQVNSNGCHFLKSSLLLVRLPCRNKLGSRA